MKRLLVLLLLVGNCFAAALPSTMVWELNTSATAANANSGGFDIASGGLPADLACTSGATTTPDCTSVTDGTWPAAVNGKWLWISGASGANWNTNGLNDGSTTTGGGCYFPITAHSTTHITINAAVGAGVCLYDSGAINVTAPNIPQHWVANTVAGVGAASPTAGTFGIDYSQATAAALASNATLGAVTVSSTTMTSTAAFDPTMVHNTVHITTTGTAAHCVVGYYEITAYTSSSAVTTNASIQDGSATSCIAGTGSIGGATSLGTSTDALPFNAAVAGNIFWMHSGTFAPTATVTQTAAGTAALPIAWVGYNALRGDQGATGTTRPIYTSSAGALNANGALWRIQNIVFSGTLATTPGATDQTFINDKFVNTSTAANGVAFSNAGGSSFVFNCEMISYRGIAISNTIINSIYESNYIHDSDVGFKQAVSTGGTLINNIFADNVTDAINITTASSRFTVSGNTFYGTEAKKGIAINIITGSGTIRALNNIFYGFATGIIHADTQQQGYDDYNDYFNNTTDVTKWQKGAHDVALNPTFSSLTQTTGTGATSSTNVLTDASATFNSVSPAIVNNQDFVFLSAGSGTGIALTKYLITAHSNTTLTLDSNITSAGSGSAISYQLTTGHNFAIGTNLKALGFPGLFPGNLATGYLDVGALQRQEPLCNDGYVQ